MDKLKTIVLNNFDAKGNIIQHDFEQFKDVETCTLNRFEVNDEIINSLNKMRNLKTIIFGHCVFTNEIKLENNLEKLMIIYCKNVKYSDILNTYQVKDLMLTKIGEVDIEEINKFESLEELSIFECEIKNLFAIENFKSLKTLKLDGSKIDNKEKLQDLQKTLNIQYKETYHVGS